MFCIHCGAQNPDGARFCNGCGKAAGASLATAKPKQQVRIWAVLLALALVLCGVWFFFFMVSLPARMVRQSLTGEPSGLLPRVPVKINVAPQAFVVSPNHWQWYPVILPEGAINGRLKGRFTVSGGMGNGVVTDEDGLENMKTHHAYRTYFNSGKVTVQTLDVRLSPGTYYVVFNNTFSLLSNKAVNGALVVEYEK